MINIAKKIFGDPNTRELNKIKPLVEKINKLEEEILNLGDADLQKKTELLREKIKNGITADEILPEAFAVVREVAKRTVKMRHFDVQLIGGIVLYQGKIAEMATGEGKTLVATLPAYLNALQDKSVHIVTVNDYLAKRDRFWMGPVYEFLGLKVGLVQHDMNIEKRKEAYQSDVVYGTNNEFGFDYLRDNMSISADEIVQSKHDFAIIDEVDSILVDEARTPLIISGPTEESTKKYFQIDKLVYHLKEEADYKINEKEKAVFLTEKGVAKMEKLLGVDNLYAQNNMNSQHHIIQALRAHKMFKRDVDYVVKDGEVIIVDEFTGRLMFGRRYSDGLHQAIEAKEKVKIGKESQTLATITLQNYFRMYTKLAGMTGTAYTESEEFHDIYGLGVVVIPTNEPMIRDDQPDAIYRTRDEKFSAVADEIEETYNNGQPVLVGTTSIENSERVSKILKARKVPHDVLNAKNHEREANIVAQAGRLGSITVATNMAGRGTDIMLGGNPDFVAREEMEKSGYTGDPQEQDDRYREIRKKMQDQCESEKEKVRELGGLKIIGTERHEARRIDNQLRGRSGRQGDPGLSRFYLSLEDDLLRLFGSEKIQGVMSKLGLEDGEAIEHGMLSKAIESAQKKVEEMHFDIRKQLLAFDNVMNQQREAVYAERSDILNDEHIIDHTWEIIDGVISELGDTYFPEGGEADPEGACARVRSLFGAGRESFLKGIDHRDDVLEPLSEFKEHVKNGFYKKVTDMESDTADDLFRFIVLHTLDHNWKDHLLAMDELRRGIGLRAIGQKDPLLEYQFESYNLFQDMMGRVRTAVTELSMRVSVVSDTPVPENEGRGGKTVESRHIDLPFMKKGEKGEIQSREQKHQPVRKGPKIGRNDPCPCGSGKKYKHCCGKNK